MNRTAWVHAADGHWWTEDAFTAFREYAHQHPAQAPAIIDTLAINPNPNIKGNGWRVRRNEHGNTTKFISA